MKETFKSIKTGGDIKIYMDEDKGTWEAKKSVLLSQIITVCEDYQEQGFTLTLRQMYYQLVAKGYIPNHDKVYKKIGRLKDDAVYGGYIDWSIFEDRGRVPHTPYYEDSIKEALEKTVRWYTLDRQQDQPTHIEVWTEKDAISSILKDVTNNYGVTLVVNKGYTSSTAIYGSYKRFVDHIVSKRKVKILYFGDHDPSGLDMIRDIKDRIMFMLTNGESLDDAVRYDIQYWWENNEHTLFDVSYMEGYEDVVKLSSGYDLKESEEEKLQDLFEVGRIKMYIEDNEFFEIEQVGLTMEQIMKYDPPHNPAKITDPRAKSYIEKYGQVSWEVDALTPVVMQEIVNNSIIKSIDLNIYSDVLDREQEEKNKITSMIKDLDDE